MLSSSNSLDHTSEQVVDVLLAVTEVTTLGEVVGLLSPAAVRVVQLEWPQEVGHLLEVRANCEDLVQDVFNADDSVLALSSHNKKKQIFVNENTNIQFNSIDVI